MTDPDVARIRELFEQWALYDAVVRHNYMRHTELSCVLAAWAAAFGRPLQIVDLGCGDAGLATTGFRTANVESYLGIDLAESAIERARGPLAIWPGRTKLLRGNLAEALDGLPAGSANTVLASYSLHHFSTADKLGLIGKIGRLLAPGGAFLWIDVVRPESESREVYLDRLTRAMAQDWVGLTEEQRVRGIEHVRAADFPETRSWLLAHLGTAGFQSPDTPLFQDEFFEGWAFTKL